MTARSVPNLGAVLHKDFIGAAERSADRQFRFTISTASVDLQMDTIAVGGWDLTAYRRNPVVLWEHGSDPTVGRWPIGRAFNVGPEKGALKASVEFDAFDIPITGPIAEACVRKLQNGSLCAVSVGFRPLEYTVTDDPARGAGDWSPGVDFTRQILLEFSIVSVPANAEALMDAASGKTSLTLSPEVMAAKAARAARQRTMRVFALGGR